MIVVRTVANEASLLGSFLSPMTSSYDPPKEAADVSPGFGFVNPEALEDSFRLLESKEEIQPLASRENRMKRGKKDP